MNTSNKVSRARFLIKRAKQNGKPIRVFLGFKGLGLGQFELVAYDTRSNLLKTLPQSEIEVSPDEGAELLGRRLEQAWAELIGLLPEAIKQTPEQRMLPKLGHGWRGRAVKLRQANT